MADPTPSFPLATAEDFHKFLNACRSEEKWNVCYDKDNIKVWDQKVLFT
jgi:hypothetical protein